MSNVKNGNKDKSPLKQKKPTNIKQNQGTFEGWNSMVNDLGLFDKKYQKVVIIIIKNKKKEKYCFKEINLINYFLEAFEMMSALKGNFTSDSFIITLIEMNVHIYCLL